jgi:hypothetical protein
MEYQRGRENKHQKDRYLVQGLIGAPSHYVDLAAAAQSGAQRRAASLNENQQY